MTPFAPFATMSSHEADAVVDAFVAATPERLAWLSDRVGTPLRPRREGLVDAWGAYLAWWNAGGADEQDGSVPGWWRDPAPTEPLAPPALTWIDAIAHYWAAVARAEHPELEWRRWDRGNRNEDIHNRPVLVLSGEDQVNLEPITPVYVLALGVVYDDPAPVGRTYAAREPEALREVHELHMRYVEQAINDRA